MFAPGPWDGCLPDPFRSARYKCSSFTSEFREDKHSLWGQDVLAPTINYLLQGRLFLLETKVPFCDAFVPVKMSSLESLAPLSTLFKKQNLLSSGASYMKIFAKTILCQISASFTN